MMGTSFPVRLGYCNRTQCLAFYIVTCETIHGKHKAFAKRKKKKSFSCFTCGPTSFSGPGSLFYVKLPLYVQHYVFMQYSVYIALRVPYALVLASQKAC